jgi:hypothetical protein
MTKLRTIIVALAALLAAAASPARAEDGTVTLQFIKAGWVIGGSFGEGILNFRGEMYAISIGGLSYGLTFGGSKTTLTGRVSNIRRASDIEGVYAAGGAGAAIIKGGQAVVLTNQNGAVLTLAGEQTGLIVNLDLSGLALTLKR